MNYKQLKKHMEDNSLELRFASIEIRSWWNPFRYILGKFYFKKL